MLVDLSVSSVNLSTDDKLDNENYLNFLIDQLVHGSPTDDD